MPRIDPLQLLTCLKPLLAPDGGIKSEAEVLRIASLMEKYSKKLVSKCIYIQILKCTQANLLGQFMNAGGWNLVHQWLKDGSDSKNLPFIQEILEMLLLCPVDSNRLKSNHTPKIVKELSLNSPSAHVKLLATKLVEQWLKIAHQEKMQTLNNQNGLNGVSDSHVDNKFEIKSENEVKATAENIKYKVSNKEGNGNIVLSLKRSSSPSVDVKDAKIAKTLSTIDELKVVSDKKEKREKDEKKEKDKKSSSSHKSSSKSSHRDKDRSSSHRSSSSSSSSRDKHHKSSSSKSSSSSSSSSRDKSKDKEKERERRKKEDKEKAEKLQAEKDKETLNFLQQPTIPSSKLQRIPKRQNNQENGEAKTAEPVEKKKPSISIEVRLGDKPKTVKTLNSQFRDHGLAAEAPKPPSRKDIKKPGTTAAAAAPVAPIPALVTSKFTPAVPASASVSPPPIKKQLEKAFETDIPERAGGVKIIKPKPMLFESIGFMDALDASTSTKKDTKKRKRLPSGSSSSKKDEPESPKIDTKPLKFYKDTLEEADEEQTNGDTTPTKELETSGISGEEVQESKENGEKSTTIESPTKEKTPEAEEENEPEVVVRPPGIGCGPDGPPGVLVNPLLQRKKKRSLRWRDDQLTDVHYFELDETERVNVTKTFNEQMQAEHEYERGAFKLGRKLQDDVMAEQTSWRRLILIDGVPSIPYGEKSIEAQIQAERERNVLQDIFFPHQSLTDSPAEPDHESYEHIEPQIIPTEDTTGNPDSILKPEISWPLPKGDIINTIHPSNAFANVFSPALNIPPALGLANNPLNIPLGVLQQTTRDPANSMWMVPPNNFLQPPPNILTNPGGVVGGANRGGNFNNNYNRSNNNNRSNNGGGGNWVRGNAGRRGVCHQFKRSGVCRNKTCPYIHER